MELQQFNTIPYHLIIYKLRLNDHNISPVLSEAYILSIRMILLNYIDNMTIKQPCQIRFS